MKWLTQRGQCSSCNQFKVQPRSCVQVKSRRRFMEGCADSYPIFSIPDTFDTVNNPLHKSTIRVGALVTSTFLPGWRATRVGPGQYPQFTRAPLWVEAVGSSQAPQPNKPNAHKSHAQLPQRGSVFIAKRTLGLLCWLGIFGDTF